jgi:hypothetical protein
MPRVRASIEARGEVTNEAQRDIRIRVTLVERAPNAVIYLILDSGEDAKSYYRRDKRRRFLFPTALRDSETEMLVRSLCVYIFLLGIMNTDSLADKIGPLSVLTTNGVQYIFDPTKVTGVYFVQSATDTSGSSLNEEKPYVWGISMSPIPIDEDGNAFLKKLGIESQFAVLHSPLGELRVRAASVTLITPPVPVPKSRSGFVTRAFVYTATGDPWRVSETPAQVQEILDGIRAQLDSPN